jgi:Family of unknown function (DUF5752)
LTGRKAASLAELHEGLGQVEGSSVYHHTHRFYRSHSFLGSWDRSDFALWVAQNLKEDAVAERMGTLDLRDYRTLEDLRRAILEAMEPLRSDPDRWNRRVPPGLEFHFCRAVSLILPTGHEARNLEEFLDGLERVDVACIYYHLIEAPLHFPDKQRPFQNDFSYWLASSLQMGDKAAEVAEINPYRGDLEALRGRILSVFRKKRFQAIAKRIAERLDRWPEGEAAAGWLKRWRKGE